MNDINHGTTVPSARPINYLGWLATLLLVVPALAMLYVSIALFYKPIRIDAAIFAVLPASPQWMQGEWYGATLVGLYALFSVRKRNLAGLAATVLLALAYVHLHLALLGNMSIPAWLAILAAGSAVTAMLVERRSSRA